MIFVKDETKAFPDKLRFRGNLKPKVFGVSSNYRIFTIIKAKHLNNYENTSKFFGELLGKLVNETADILYYIK